MADVKKELVVLNRGNRAYHTSVGWLRPGCSQSLPLAEGKALVAHSDLVDAATVVPPSNVEKSLRDENAALKLKVEQLEKELEHSKSKSDEKLPDPKSEPKKSGGK